MLRFMSGCTRNCAGVTRREFLGLGALTALGISLPDALWSQAAQAASEAGASGAPATRSGASCILLWQDGGPSHLDTFDPKPDAPSEIRGEFGQIPTNVPGTYVSEIMPHLARQADKFSILRSVTQDGPADHGYSHLYMLCGTPPPRGRLTSANPCYGSVVAKLRGGQASVPPYVQLYYRPYPPIGNAAHGATFLGPAYEPMRTATLEVPPDLALPGEVSLSRLEQRRGLLHALDRFQREMEPRLAELRGIDAVYERAFSLITSAATKRAFDLSEEPDRVRDAYGRNVVGQRMLLARRLVAAGVRFVTVNADPGNVSWDTHPENFPRLRDQLVPPFEQGYAALLADLAERGMLESTLVIAMGEFGRTPRLNDDPRGPGRDHWHQCYSVALGGGGLKTGIVVGASDRIGAYPDERPIRVPDLAATIYHALGIDPQTLLQTPEGRPVALLAEGEVIRELL